MNIKYCVYLMEFTYLRVLCTWWYKYSGLWHCVIEWMIADVSEKRNFFFFDDRNVPELGTFYHWKWRQWVQSKRLQSHGNTVPYRWRPKFSERTLWERQVLRKWVELSWHPVKRRQMEVCKTAARRKPSRPTSFRVCKCKAPRSVPLLCRTIRDRRYA